MDTTGLPAPQPGVGITSQIEMNRSKPKLLRNSRILWWMTISGSLAGGFLGVCSALGALSTAFPLRDLSAARGSGILTWIAYSVVMSSLCLYLWILLKPMAGCRVFLDGHGATFSLGTKKAPTNLFIAWDQISAIKTRRAGAAREYWVEGKDGSEARFSSNTFFRPKRVARTIAKRAGLAIQKG